MKATLLTLAISCSILLELVHGDGYMIDPPGRPSHWRVPNNKFPGPAQYTDNELNCGGVRTQWDEHHGKCGVCGDEYDTR